MKKITMISGLLFLFYSCDSSTKEASLSTSDSGNGKVESKSNGNSYECLNKFQDDFDLLLTKEEMASVYPIPFDQAEVNLSSGSYGEHIYSWESDRGTFTMEISGTKMEIPDQNTMGVKRLSFSNSKDLKSAISYFDMSYKELSDDEHAQIKSNLEKEDKETQKTGEEFMEVRNKMKFEFVDEVGSSAWYKWSEKFGGELAVLGGKAQFNTVAKISDDPEENKRITIELAKKILAKCE